MSEYYDERIFKLCFLAGQIYKGDSLPVEAFNKHLSRMSHAETVRTFTGGEPRLKELGEIAVYLQAVSLMERIMERTKEIFSSHARFSTNTDILQKSAPSSAAAAAERAAGGVFSALQSEKRFFDRYANTDCPSRLLRLLWQLEGECEGLVHSEDVHFITNSFAGRDMADRVISGSIIFFDSITDSRIKDCFGVFGGRVMIKPIAPKFVITRSRLSELAKRG